MATPRQLERPPVVEAIVDVKASTDLSEEALRNLAAELKSEFPKLKVMRNFTANLEVKDGKLVPPSEAPFVFGGVHALSEDETRIAQFRPDGFTFNNLRRYMGGDELLSTATRLWRHFEGSAKPGAATRIAVRYINRLELPLTDGVDLDGFLTSVPRLPTEVPQNISEFLSRVVTHQDGRPEAVVLTQRLTYDEMKPIVVLDIDAILEGPSVNETSVADSLGRLRSLVNRAFFSLITEETAKLYY